MLFPRLSFEAEIGLARYWHQIPSITIVGNDEIFQFSVEHPIFSQKPDFYLAVQNILRNIRFRSKLFQQIFKGRQRCCMKLWSLLFCFLLPGSAFAQWEGNYTLVEETEGCPEGSLIMSQERIILGARLSFDLTQGVIESQEEECLYLTKTEITKSPVTLRITRWTERKNCKEGVFNGRSEEVLSLENRNSRYHIQSFGSDGKKAEEITCQYIKLE